MICDRLRLNGLAFQTHNMRGARGTRQTEFEFREFSTVQGLELYIWRLALQLAHHITIMRATLNEQCNAQCTRLGLRNDGNRSARVHIQACDHEEASARTGKEAQFIALQMQRQNGFGLLGVRARTRRRRS
jgi:hypothetical protein